MEVENSRKIQRDGWERVEEVTQKEGEENKRKEATRAGVVIGELKRLDRQRRKVRTVKQEREDKHYLLLLVCLNGSAAGDYRSELIRMSACVCM